MSKLINLIHLEEGLRHTPYYCSEGYPTIGYGFKIGKKGAPLPEFTLPKSVCDAWLEDLLDKIKLELSQFEWYVNLNDARKAIIISMCYQIGFSGVMKFKKMIKAIELGDYKTAALEMLDSRWAKQTPSRANRHSDQFCTGEWLSYYIR